MSRREWLCGVAAAGLSLRHGNVSAGHSIEPAPTTIAQAIGRLESLISPEAMAEILNGPDESLIEFSSGIHTLINLRWRMPHRKFPASLVREFDAQRIGPREWAAYLVSALWRRRRRLSIGSEESLKVFRRQTAEREASKDAYQKALPKGTRVFDLGIFEYFYIPDGIRYEHGTIVPVSRIESESSAANVAAFLSNSRKALLVEAYGHAAANETDPAQLSLARAHDAVTRVVGKGAEPSRLTAAGMGTRFSLPAPVICPAGMPWWKKVDTDGDGPRCLDPGDPKIIPSPARNRRVEFVILRRRWALPDPPPAQPRDSQQHDARPQDVQ